MYPSNENIVLIHLLDFYLQSPHCACGNKALWDWVVLPFQWEIRILLMVVSAHSWWIPQALWNYLPDTQDKREKQASPVLPTLKLPQSTHHNSSAALSLTCSHRMLGVGRDLCGSS